VETQLRRLAARQGLVRPGDDRPAGQAGTAARRQAGRAGHGPRRRVRDRHAAGGLGPLDRIPAADAGRRLGWPRRPRSR